MRRPALVLVLLLAVFGVVHDTAAAKGKGKRAPAPVISKVSPLKAVVGQQLTIHGKHFRPGKGRNGVGFKADGKPIVFVKSGLSTRRMMRVTPPARLEKVLAGRPKRFRLRVLTSRLGTTYTPKRRSPTIAPRRRGASPGAPVATSPTLPGGATGTGVPIANCVPSSKSTTADQDADRLSDALEASIATDPCNADTDADRVEDGYEYRSAIDLNDDEYQAPNSALPYPGKRPYPNPLDSGDANTDYDGDALSMREEYTLWLASTPAATRSFADVGPRATPLSYSDGLQYSVSAQCPAAGSPACGPGDAGRRVPTLAAGADPSFQDFYAWATAAGYAQVAIGGTSFQGATKPRAVRDVRDLDLSGAVSATEANPLDRDADGFISDDERDADVDGLSNFDELHGAMVPRYWSSCYAAEPAYPLGYQATAADDADSDGDGVRDGADDEDHDGVPNLMELSRRRAAASASAAVDDREVGRDCKPAKAVTDAFAAGVTLFHAAEYGSVNPFNPCLPFTNSPTCRNQWDDNAPAPFTGPIWWALQ